MRRIIPKAVTNKPGEVVSIWNFVEPASTPISLKLWFCVSVPLLSNIWSPIRVMPVRMIRTPIRITIEPLLLVRTLFLLKISAPLSTQKGIVAERRCWLIWVYSPLDMHSNSLFTSKSPSYRLRLWTLSSTPLSVFGPPNFSSLYFSIVSLFRCHLRKSLSSLPVPSCFRLRSFNLLFSPSMDGSMINSLQFRLNNIW